MHWWIILLFVIGAGLVGAATGGYYAYSAGQTKVARRQAAEIVDAARTHANKINTAAMNGGMAILEGLRDQAQAEATRIVDNARGIAEVDDSELLERITEACAPAVGPDGGWDEGRARAVLAAVRG